MSPRAQKRFRWVKWKPSSSYASESKSEEVPDLKSYINLCQVTGDKCSFNSLTPLTILLLHFEWHWPVLHHIIHRLKTHLLLDSDTNATAITAAAAAIVALFVIYKDPLNLCVALSFPANTLPSFHPHSQTILYFRFLLFDYSFSL